MHAGLQFVAAGEVRLVLQDAYSELLEALDRIVGRDGRDRLGDVVHHPAEIDSRFDGRDAEFRAAALRLRGLGGGDQGLRWHAAEVEAVAAHQAAFDQHDVDAELGGTGGGDQPGRAAAHHADVRRESLAHVCFLRPLMRA